MRALETPKHWSPIRKAQVIGAVLGPVVTAIAFVISTNHTGNDDVSWWLLGLNLLLCAPALLILRLFGVIPVFGPQSGSPWTPFLFFALFTNMVVFSLAGTAIAWFCDRRRARKGKAPP